ncbi:uncharacterized protein LOC119957192 [Scyliorhinus canicula]|uniref:uncharacterized protein LOC119957192 n=1 Tax=Scyliorhinus canicula TaxID=7830 RepID=UPI0018F63BDC|nr:uncharacterized protein LOC119957192 [Scyliorhinus canicula]XP_038640928.1 uncharacterized protein LOC119957192 [Scyliorhinus canicula]
MAEVEGGEDMTTQKAEEHPAEISTAECENPNAPSKERAAEPTANEDIIEKEATEEATVMEVQREGAGSGEINVEEQAAGGNEGGAGEGEVGPEKHNGNMGSGLALSAEAAKEENLREAIDSTDVGLKAGVGNPCMEELPNGNSSKSVEDGQNQLRESEGQGCREATEVLIAMKDTGLSSDLEGTMGENAQHSEHSQAPCTAGEGRSGAPGTPGERQTGQGGMADILLDVVAKPDFKEHSEGTKVSVNSGETIAGQRESSTATDNGSVAAGHGSGKSSEVDTLLEETQEDVASAPACHDQEPPLQTTNDAEEDLEIQAHLKPSAERTSEAQASTGDDPAENTEEQATTNDAAPSRDTRGASDTSLEQQCETGVSESEEQGQQEQAAPGDDQIIVPEGE